MKIPIISAVLSYGFSGTPVEYPPSALTNDSTTLSGLAYGNGVYTVTTSRQDVSYKGFRAFNKLVQDAGWYTGASTYNSSTGAWTGGTSFGINNIFGDWINIHLPTPGIVLTSYRITNRSVANSGQAPWKYVILGSNDNAVWTIVDDKRTTGIAWASGTSEQVIAVSDFTNSTRYEYYALVATHTAAGLGLANGSVLSINELRLFGY